MSFFLVSILALLLTLLPLEFRLPMINSPGVVSDFWNGPGLLLFSVQILFYIFIFLSQSIKINARLIGYCLLSSISIVGIFIIQKNLDPSATQLLRLLLVVWLIPIIDLAITTIGAKKVAILILAIGTIHSVWGVGQFIIQQDLGLHLIGESQLSPTASGVAKFLIQDSNSTHKVIRAYGPYPHANSLAGVLLVALVIAIALLRQRISLPLFIITCSILLGLLLTFSRAAWLGVLIVFVSQTLFARKKSQDVRRLYALGIVIVVTLLVFMPLILSRIADPQDVAQPERVAGTHYAFSLIKQHPWWGNGIGRYTAALQNYLQGRGLAYAPWQLTPVHSVPLLLIAEYGLIGTCLLVLPLGHWLYRQKNTRHWLIIAPLLPPLLLDHYFFTQLSPLVFLLVLLMLVPHLRLPSKIT